MKNLAEKFGNQIKIMNDSGLCSGPDVARCLTSGATFTFMGRPFTYGVGALEKKGDNQNISILKIQLQQVMEQLCCEKIEDFPNHSIH